ncbi:protein PNS1 isoform X2 [Solanum dulcamara]|uniref:protein PNS1 isoform X2 n=1 Tax=Solanum dulcamara TaxID=45834 RepID=UPI0024851734|nr:protein PNS1 isoform X2 [Solanum dulcamara]
MGAVEPVAEEENGEKETKIREEEERDVEKGEMDSQQRGFQNQPPPEAAPAAATGGENFHMERMQRLSATNPLRLVMNAGTRVASPSPYHAPPPAHHHQRRSFPNPFHHRHPPAPVPVPMPSQHHPPPAPIPVPAPAQHHPSPAPSQTRSTPTTTPQQPSVITLNSRSYTNKFSLFLFVVHMIGAIGLVCFLVFKGIQGLLEAGEAQRKEKRLLKYFLPQVEAASLLSITLAFIWQKALRMWPTFMVHFILWSSFILTLSAGILLICFQRPSTDGVGVVFIMFAIGNGLYSCWVTPRIKFCTKILIKSLEPVPKFGDLNRPTYLTLGAGFLWMSMWILAVIGAINFYFPPLIIIALVLSMAWVTEVMRNVVNLTVSRVIALYYLRGMQSSTQFCFQRALSVNLGSACLGSLFVPAIEALRIVARGLNLLEGEDEFMFCCAHCGLKIMDSIFKRGNGWAYVQIATYGKSFVKASQDTWELFQKREMETIVDSDMTSAICFLTGVCSGSICVIVIGAWTFTVYPNFTATLSLLSAYVGYLMTRIAMALPHACVSSYYVCYAENPDNRLFDKTIQERLNLIKSDRDIIVPTPRSVTSRSA